MFSVDSAVARRLEIASARRGIEYARAVERLHPDDSVAVLEVGGGFAVYTGPNYPINRASGQGWEKPVEPSDLESIDRFFWERDAEPRVSVCPLAHPSWLALLASTDYRLDHFFNVLVRPLFTAKVDPVVNPSVRVEVAGRMDRELWLRTVAQGFDAVEDPRPETLEVLAPNFDSFGAACYLAWVSGEPAGGGELFVHEGVAELGSASTRPAFRRQGVHRALVHARLDAARSAGCDLAMALTSPGSESQRSLERAGFCVAYTQVVVARARRTNDE